MKLIKIPAKNALGKTQGTQLAPDKLINELEKMGANERGNKKTYLIGKIQTGNDPEQNNKTIYEYMMQNDQKPLIIGGDHSITYPCFKAFSKKFNNPGIVIFDAHPDCVNNFKPPTHEDYLKVLIEEKLVKPQNVIVIGLRAWDKKEYWYLKNNKIKNFPMKNITNMGKEDVCDVVMSAARSFGACYVSIDIDAVDPAFAPGTGYIEPGGLSSRQLLYFIQRLKLLKNIKAWDLVEINPKKDINNLTIRLGAKIINEINQKIYNQKNN